MTIEEIKTRLEGALTNKRFVHSVNVMNTAIILAEKYGAGRSQAQLAGLLHDCARDIRGSNIFKACEEHNIQVDMITREQPELLHGPIGVKLAETVYGVNDEAVLDAICNHTIGCENMGMLTKIIFLADYIEPTRTFPGVEDIRKAADENIDRALILSFDSTIRHVMSKGGLIHPNAILARNYILGHLGKSK